MIHALRVLELVMYSTDQAVAAESVYKQSLAIGGSSDEELRELAPLLTVYSGVLNKVKRFEEAEKVARQAVDLNRRLHGDQHPETAWGLRALGFALQSQQKLDEAEAALHDSLRIFRRGYSDDHLYVQLVRDKLKKVLEARGDKAALEAFAKDEAEYSMRSDTPSNHIRLAELLLSDEHADDKRQEKKEEASRQFQRAIEQYRHVPSESPNDFALRMGAADGLARLLMTCVATPGFGKEVDAINQCLATELPQLLADFPDENGKWQSAMCYNSWGRILIAYNDHLPTAEHAFSQTIEILTKLSVSVPNRPYVWIWLASAYAGLGDAQWRSGRLVDAEAPLRLAMKIYDEHAAKIAADIAADPYPWINSEIIVTYIKFAFYLAATDREKEAADFVGKAALNAKHLTVPAELANASYYLALAQLRLGDETGYRETCKALVDVPLNGADDLTKQAPIWSWCLGPAALEDMTLPVKRAEEYVATNKLNQRHYALQTLGAALYRAGQFDRAAEQLNASIAAYPSDPVRGYDTINYTRLLLAMTKWQQGRQDEARHVLAEAQRAIDLELHDPTIFFHRRATLEVFRREANALIGKVPNDQAKQEETPSDSPSNP